MQVSSVSPKSSRRILGLGLLPLVFMLSLAACGPQTSVAAPASTVQSTAVSAANTSAPASGGSAQPTLGAQVTTAPAAAAQATSAPAAAAGAKVNLNTATAAEFLKLPNVGSNIVREFNEYRPWTSILQFRRELGKYVDAQTIAGFEQYVYVPVSINSADAETLQQLPGVDKTISAQLVAGRPYANNDAFLQSLTKLVGADKAAVAKTYLAVQ